MSWLFSRALVAEYSAENCSGGEPSAPLNLMLTERPFLLSDKTMAFSSPSQFGLTCRRLTVPYGVELLTLYLADFPAKTSAQQDVEQESKASSPASGWKWPASFVKYDHDSRSWKTRQCSLLGGLESYSETWPRWGSMHDGECSVLPTPALLISEKESGLWPTPRASASGPDFASLTRHKNGISLPTAVALYPTPRSTDGDRGGRGDLIQAVRGNPNKHYKFPTPHGFSKDGRSNGPNGNELGRAVNRSFPTPVSTSATGGRKGLDGGAHVRARLVEDHGEEAMRELTGGSLNPTWVEWLMGWPIGWTDLNPLEMDKYRQWLRSHGGR